MHRLKNVLFVLSLFLASSVTADQNFEFSGTHFTASYKACDRAALTNIPALKAAMLEAAKASGAQVLGLADYIFEPDGYTMVILLSESHASVHTYPEYDACFVDLFTCGHNCSAKAFDECLQKYLKPQTVNAHLADRS